MVISSRYLYIWGIFLAFYVMGCSSSRTVKIHETPEGIYYGGLKSPIDYPGSSVQLIDGTILPADDIRLEGDSISWSDSGLDRIIHIDSIKQIIGSNHLLGGIEGFAIGYMAGILPGMVIGGGIDATDPHEGGFGWIVGAVVGSAVGATAGIIYAGIKGHTYRIGFERDR